MIIIVEEFENFTVVNMTTGSVLGNFKTLKEAEAFKYKVLH